MIYGLILGIQFLTRIPLNVEIEFNSKNISKSIFFYPLIGALLGLISYLSYFIFSKLLLEIGALFTVVSMIILTGGLHLDGLSDTFDGFYSNRSKEEILDIMKDSRIGAFGVIILIIDIFSKYIIISNMDYNIHMALILSMANSRLVLGNRMSYGKVAKENGLGHMFNESNPKFYSNLSFLFYIIILIILNPYYIIPLLFNIILAFIITKIAYEKIDGFTGDVYGALIELGEIISLLIFVGVFKWI